jgi:hypothetical protein
MIAIVNAGLAAGRKPLLSIRTRTRSPRMFAGSFTLIFISPATKPGTALNSTVSATVPATLTTERATGVGHSPE